MKCFFGKRESSLYGKGSVDADEIVYSTDRNTLLREAREKAEETAY